MSDFAEDTNVLTNDCISRQSAIDAIYDAFCYAYCDNCEKEMNEDLCGDCHRKYQNWSASKKIIEKVINNLPSVQPEIRYYGQFEIKDPILISERQWIPVSERLPEKNRVVVVCGDKGTWDFGTYRGHGDNIHFWHWKKNTYKRVYWWMYKEDALPEPYKGEQG